MPPHQPPELCITCTVASQLSFWATTALLSAALLHPHTQVWVRFSAAEPQRNTGQGAVHCYETEKEVPCGNYGFSKESAGGSDESVLLCGRWFGIGNKCGRRQTISLIRRNCCCTSCILMEALNGNGSISYLGKTLFCNVTWMLFIRAIEEENILTVINIRNQRNAFSSTCFLWGR